MESVRYGQCYNVFRSLLFSEPATQCRWKLDRYSQLGIMIHTYYIGPERSRSYYASWTQNVMLDVQHRNVKMILGHRDNSFKLWATKISMQ